MERGIYEKRPGSGVWYVRYSLDGVIRRERAGTKTAARDLLLLRRQQRAAGESVIPKRRNPRLRDWVESVYLPSISTTHRDYPEIRLRFAKWLDVLGQRRIRDVRQEDVEAFRANLLRRGRAPATANRYLAILRRALNVAVEHDVLDRNPAARVKNLRENNARDRYLDRSEEEALLAELPTDLDRAHVRLAVLTGMRRGEQFAIRPSQIDWVGATITVPRSKSGERRYVYLSDPAIECLAVLDQEGWLGAETRVCGANFVRRVFRPAVSRAGLSDLRWHDLRHTFGSRLAQAGHNPQTIRELMGHKSIEMTYRYMHLAPGGLHDAVRSISTDPKTDPRPRLRVVGSQKRS